MLLNYPHAGKPNGLLDNPDSNLTEIVRQESNNAIVKLAEMARNGQEIRTGNYGNVIVVYKNLLTEDQLKNILTKADQVLCGTNRTRYNLNQQIKGYLGLDKTILNKNEKIICLLNNWEESLDEDGNYSLVNGIIGTAINPRSEDQDLELGKLSFKADFLDDVCEDLLFDTKIFRTGEFKYEFHTSAYLMDDGSYQIREPFKKQMNSEDRDAYLARIRKYIMTKKNAVAEEPINFFHSAYAISVHKSQGSEWDTGVIFDESRFFEDPNKWLYTAITRFKKKLIIIK